MKVLHLLGRVATRRRPVADVGEIRCRSCHHVGPSRGLWDPSRGIRPACGRCGGEDWIPAVPSGRKA